MTAIPMTIDDRLLVVIAGPTAVGKTAAGIKLARYFSTEIISADSRQFYREMKIGTSAPSEEELSLVRHHFVHQLSIVDHYNVSRFETDAIDLLGNLFRHHRIVLMVGGSGLYINAVCHGIDLLPDPDPGIRRELKDLLAISGIGALQDELLVADPGYAKMVDLSNPARLIRALEVCRLTGVAYSSLRSEKPKLRPFRILKLGLELPREILNTRINDRVDSMMEAGLLQEARHLSQWSHMNALNTVGYRELFDHFSGLTSFDHAVEKIRTNTRRYAKRQMTWFRRDRGMTWFSPGDIDGMIAAIENF